MSSTLNKRRKPGFRRPESQPDSSSSHSSMMEPPHNLFPTKGEFFSLVAVVAIASFVAFTCHLIAGYMYPSTMPFCDTRSDSLDSISEFCEPCPRNGECYQGKLECSQGYRKHGNICIEDGDIDKRAKKLSEWVEDHICESYSQFLCYGKGTVWIPEKEIWNALDGHELMQNFGSDSWIYLLTKKKVTETIGRLMELKLNSLGNKELKCPDSLAEHYKPLTCHIRQWISKHAFIALLFCSTVLGSIVLLFKIQRRRNLSARVEQLYQQVCEVLEESALISKKERGECESWVVASRLRDHLLSPKERKDPVLWKKVENLVQEDSRIDQYPKLVKGESKVVWEWQVEGALSSTGIKRRGEGSKFVSDDASKVKSAQESHPLNSGLRRIIPSPKIQEKSYTEEDTQKYGGLLMGTEIGRYPVHVSYHHPFLIQRVHLEKAIPVSRSIMNS